MGSQIAQTGAQATLNHLSGYSFPVVSSTPPTWYPGIVWVNGTGNVQSWNGSAWSTITQSQRYLALLTADPSTSGSGGGPAVNISDLQEMTTAGYNRQLTAFTAASATYPSLASNTGVLTFGTFTAPMTTAAGWAALVTVATGTSGYLLCTWALAEPLQASTGQSIQFAIGQLVMDQS